MPYSITQHCKYHISIINIREMETSQILYRLMLTLVVFLLLHGAAVSSEKEEAAPTGHCDREAEPCSTATKHLFSIPPIQVGHIEEIDIDPPRKIHRKTLSLKPALFEIPHFLTAEECDHMKKLATRSGLKQSQTFNNGGAYSGPIQVMDIDSNKKLDSSEMRLTLENSYDIYFNDEDVFKMYKALKIDTNNDGILTPAEFGRIQPGLMQNWLSAYIHDNPTTQSRVSSQVWLYLDQIEDKIVRGIQDRVVRLTGLLPGIVAHSDVQVVRYSAGGHYHAHYDSSAVLTDKSCCSHSIKDSCRICRYMTVMFYLSDVTEGGGTAFPVADNATLDTKKLRSEHRINLREHCHDANLVVKPSRGKAVMWYNHAVDGATSWMGEMDEFSWHGSCPVTSGEKWIANFWIKTTDNKEADIRRMNL